MMMMMMMMMMMIMIMMIMIMTMMMRVIKALAMIVRTTMASEVAVTSQSIRKEKFEARKPSPR